MFKGRKMDENPKLNEDASDKKCAKLENSQKILRGICAEKIDNQIVAC